MRNKVNYTFKFISIILFFTANYVYSQNVWTLERVIEETLKNNYSISIARENQKISQNNFSLGNAGFLPSVIASGVYTRSNTNNYQQYNTGQEFRYDNVNTDNLNAGVALNWTIFDGFRMFASLDLYKQLKLNGELNTKAAIESSLADVMINYYSIVREEKILKAYKNSLDISEIRLQIIQDKKELGSASKFDVLQAEVDRNEDKSNVLNQEDKIKRLKNQLLQLVGKSNTTDFVLADSIDVGDGLLLEQLKSAALKSNTDLLIADQKLSISNINTRITKSDLLPRLSVNVGYNFNRAENDINQVKISRAYGINYGVNAQWNLFDGLNTKRNLENLEIQNKISSLEYENLKTNIFTSLNNFYISYTTNLNLIQLEKQNLDVAFQNTDIAKEKIRLGTISYLEFRKIQNDLLNAESRLLNAEFNTKSAQINLLKLSGTLLN